MAAAAGLTWLTERLCRRARPLAVPEPVATPLPAAARSVEVTALLVRAAPLLLTNTVVLSSFVGVEFDANASARTRPALSVLIVKIRLGREMRLASD